jgi:hypothetical protein
MAMQGNFHQSQPQYHAPHPHLAMSPSQQLPGMPNAGAGMFHASQGLMGSFQVPMYGGDSYADGSQGQNHHPMHYAALAQNMAALPSPVSAIDQQHQAQFAVQPFSTPPLAQAAQLPHVQQTPPTAATRPAPSQAQVRVKHEAASPGSPSQDQSQQDLADLLGSLNVDEKGSGMSFLFFLAASMSGGAHAFHTQWRRVAIPVALLFRLDVAALCPPPRCGGTTLGSCVVASHFLTS